jgi:hypothetical protein
MNSFGFRVIAIVTLTFASICASVAKERWATYSNPRFGTTADYPADLFTVLDPPPENGDGQGFKTTDGRAHLLIWGSWNAGDDTPKSYFDRDIDVKGTSVTYEHITEHFFVASGMREGKVFYDRCNFSARPDAAIHCFSISYPEQEKTEWNSIVSRLSRSLRAVQVHELPN